MAKISIKKYKEGFAFNQRLLPYNKKTEEFVFQGTDWYQPCKAVVEYLMKKKMQMESIRFLSKKKNRRHRRSDRSHKGDVWTIALYYFVFSLGWAALIFYK